ncbi:MAG: glycoside hydrolase family 78 protein [Anaerolineaceae bacterium]|nr:glycoside hydrolase family 78 protein [Anaerolineaceae bacterium]
MRISRMKTNHVVNPLGFALGQPRLSWVVEDTDAKTQTAAQVIIHRDDAGKTVLFDSGRQADIDSLAYPIQFSLKPYSRYYWQVKVWGDNGDSAESDFAWFETAKLDQPWQAEWITPDDEDKDIHPLLRKSFELDKEITSARIYACGVGLYHIFLNGEKVGDEVLAPGYHAYDKWLQYQTYDVTNQLQKGKNALGAMLGNGWYRGRWGFNAIGEPVYGDTMALLLELHLTFSDGSSQIITTDDSWKAAAGPVVDSSIYDGETYDAAKEIEGWNSPEFDESAYSASRTVDLGFDILEARRSMPIKIMEELKPVEVIHTPAGETVLDMGQNMVGWIRFTVDAPAGTEILLNWGEVMQQDNFFNQNYRSARSEYCYISNGNPAVVEPFFTFFGGRYIKVSGWQGELKASDFTGCVIYSDMEQTGHIETSNPLVNQLIHNALWGQKGNFVDVPTDCPQRDERMGWTGDAQVFSGTACYNMDTAEFFNKYMYDLALEQKAENGLVPHVIPAGRWREGGTCAWGDAATVIPWNVYLHYGDKTILEQQFESMKAWVDFIKRKDEESGNHRLWTVGFHFGDWLALDGDDPKTPFGGTENGFLASAYYCYSATLVSKAAKVLGKEAEAQEYQALANEVRQAIQKEYFTPTGRLALNNQTAYVVALFMNIVPEEFKSRVAEDLRGRLKRDKNHLKTGFIGTPYLARTLSAFGANDIAYTLLLNEDYPGWLYAVKLGATTIWERWNSLLPDGTISDLTMNSFNHYAYGSIVEWMFRNMLGLQPTEETPGFRRICLAPQPDTKLKWAKGSLDSAAGLYKSAWKIGKVGDLTFDFTIPFNASAALRLPDAELAVVRLNGKVLAESGLETCQEGKDVLVELTAGSWQFTYQPTCDYKLILSTHTPLGKLMKNKQAVEAIQSFLPDQMKNVDADTLNAYATVTMRDLSEHPGVGLSEDVLDQIDAVLKEVPLD